MIGFLERPTTPRPTGRTTTDNKTKIIGLIEGGRRKADWWKTESNDKTRPRILFKNFAYTHERKKRKKKGEEEKGKTNGHQQKASGAGLEEEDAPKQRKRERKEREKVQSWSNTLYCARTYMY